MRCEKCEAEIPADLVIDASGRRSLASDWLEKAGYDRPKLMSIDPHVASASRMVAMPKKWAEVNAYSIKTVHALTAYFVVT